MPCITETPALSALLERESHPDTEAAISELTRMKSTVLVLLCHVKASKRQTDSTIAALAAYAASTKEALSMVIML